jgi:glutamine synthetase
VYTAWGLENREAPLRFVQGVAGQREHAANFEVKCFDLTANPYLVVAALLFAGSAGLDAGARLPEPVDVDPGSLGDGERAERGITRLPQTLTEAVAAFETDDVLKEAFGAELATTLMDVRRGEIEQFATLSPDELCATMRWLH